MNQLFYWRQAPLIWTRAQPAQAVLWNPRDTMHPACDPRNPPPPDGWHWTFAAQVWPTRFAT